MGKGMKLIPLNHGLFAKVSDEDYTWLSQWSWAAVKCSSTGSFYAQRAIGHGKSRAIVRMGRFVLGLSSEDKRMADHKNGITLDNTRDNLRAVTHRQNQQNMK